jgi:hypothetical protein
MSVSSSDETLPPEAHSVLPLLPPSTDCPPLLSQSAPPPPCLIAPSPHPPTTTAVRPTADKLPLTLSKPSPELRKMKSLNSLLQPATHPTKKSSVREAKTPECYVDFPNANANTSLLERDYRPSTLCVPFVLDSYNTAAFSSPVKAA